jgi:hypothetical protein
MLIDTGDDYPLGQQGELAVCYFLKSEAWWSFERVKDRAAAEVEFQKALGQSDVLTVMIERGPQAGRASLVAWIAECDGDIWRRIKETPGAMQHMELWE